MSAAAKAVLGLTAVAAIAGCSSMQRASSVPFDREVRVSMDYYAASAGDTNLKAFAYGGKTVVEVPGGVTWVTVADERGVPLEAERIGHYYRLTRRVDRFTVHVNARSVAFRAATPPLTSKTAELDSSAVGSVPITSVSDEAARAVPVKVWRETAALTGVVSVSVRFPRLSISPLIDAELRRTLIDQALAASAIELRGHTDSVVAGPRDASIAAGRAAALRDYLAEHGVPRARMTVSSASEGEFAVTNTTDAGKALNRRVDIKLAKLGTGQS